LCSQITENNPSPCSTIPTPPCPVVSVSIVSAAPQAPVSPNSLSLNSTVPSAAT